MTVRQIELIVRNYEQGYQRQSWHGTNLRGSIRGLTPEAAAWRPGPERHNIWEIVVHAAYWKYAVRRRLTGEKRGSFPLAGSDWFERPEIESESAWKKDRALLDEMHRSLRDAIKGLDAEGLMDSPPGGKTTRFELLSGIAAHDLYHAGQIQLIKRLYESGGSARAETR